MGAFGKNELDLMLKREFAPWIQALNIELGDLTNTGMHFVLPKNADLVRSGDVLCGQAIAAVADTVSVLALFAHNDPPRPLTTVDMNVQFLRPMFLGDMAVEAIIQSNGKRMANVRCAFRAVEGKGAGKLCASAACTFTYI